MCKYLGGKCTYEEYMNAGNPMLDDKEKAFSWMLKHSGHDMEKLFAWIMKDRGDLSELRRHAPL